MRYIVRHFLKNGLMPFKNYMHDIDKYVVYKIIRKYNLKEALSLPSLSLYLSLKCFRPMQWIKKKNPKRIHVNYSRYKLLTATDF